MLCFRWSLAGLQIGQAGQREEIHDFLKENNNPRIDHLVVSWGSLLWTVYISSDCVPLL